MAQPHRNPRLTSFPPGSIYPRLYANAIPAEEETRPAANNVNGLLAVDLQHIWHWLSIRAKFIVAFALISAMLAAAYAITAPPRFSASTELLIDPSNLRVVNDDLYAQNQQRDSQLLAAESKIRILTSKNVLERVIDELNLTDDREFSSSPGLLATLLGLTTEQRNEQTVALRTLSKQVSARRDERSFVVTLSVWTLDAEKSVRISNAIVAAFKNELAQADAESARRAADSLVERLGELKQSVTEAEAAVETFKRDNNLQSTAGELMSNNQLTALNAQVLDAQRQLTEARSRYDILRSGGTTEANAAQLESTVINALRAQRATLVQQSSALSAVFGPLHPRVTELNPQFAAIDSQIKVEMERLTTAARNEVARAQAAVAELVARTSLQGSTVYSENDSQVALRELERDAAAKAAIYENYLARARQVTELQQLDTTNVRVISNPVEPTKRSWPPSTSQIAILGFAFGLSIGALLAIARGLMLHLRPAR